VLQAQFLALVAQALPHPLPEAGGVDQLELALAVRELMVRHYPQVRRDAGVVEHLRRERDDGLYEITL